jgi:hypothetical protein
LQASQHTESFRTGETLALLHGDRVDWWEPVTLLGSALWWVEWWVRRTQRDTFGAVDPAVAREPDYYFDDVIRRPARLTNLVAAP